MAKNFIQPGEILTIVAGGAVASGSLQIVGSAFGIAMTAAAASGDEYELMTGGVWDLAKAPSQAWTVGALIYWDAGNSRCTTVSSGNTKIGVAVLAVGSGAGETTGRVRLNTDF